MSELDTRIKNAWEGRISGCMLGKAVERFSMRQGQPALAEYLANNDALPLRDYIPYTADLPTPLEVLRKTDTVPGMRFAVTRSMRPSPSRSA